MYFISGLFIKCCH